MNIHKVASYIYFQLSLMAELFFALYFIKAFVQSEELKTIFQGGETDIKARKGTTQWQINVDHVISWISRSTDTQILLTS